MSTGDSQDAEHAMATASLEAAFTKRSKSSICISQGIRKAHAGQDLSRSAPHVFPLLPQKTLP